MISLVDVRKSFATAAGELQVLKGIDAFVERGEMAAIVGASGVGKSTLLHIMGTLDRPTSGTVTYEGTDVFSLGEKALTAFRNKTVGFVFQFHHLLPEFTALENVLMPALINGSMDRREALRTALGLLEELGISDRRDHRPGELSGGEQQRVAVARALVLSPSVVLADEPTGNLDTATGEELFRLLLGLNETRRITFVLVTHNESLSSRCHRIFEMKDGRLAAKQPA
jgi:lipoprotein-releasing system ATP-binding protein